MMVLLAKEFAEQMRVAVPMPTIQGAAPGIAASLHPIAIKPHTTSGAAATAVLSAAVPPQFGSKLLKVIANAARFRLAVAIPDVLAGQAIRRTNIARCAAGTARLASIPMVVDRVLVLIGSRRGRQADGDQHRKHNGVFHE
jgi:hypothetical protein